MKKIIILLFSFSAFGHADACDVCGCGVGNFNPYMFPHLSRNFFSLSYQHRYYRTHFVENGVTIDNREYYNTYAFAMQFSPIKNFQLMVVLPFQINHQSGPEGDKSLDRFGDAVLLANYKVFDHISGKASAMLRQGLQFGGGIKLPTGDHKFDEANTTDVGNSNFQAGSGSMDFLLNAFYSLRYKKFAFSTGLNYKINTANKDGYRFGNRLLNMTQVKYIRDIGSISIIPSVGLMAEKMGEDKQNGAKLGQNFTGGYSVQAMFGVDVNSKKWALGFNYSTTVKQNLAAGQIHEMPGMNVHLSFSF